MQSTTIRFMVIHTGLELQVGVSGVANILAGKGSEMDPCLVPALILLLGASDFANVMEMLDFSWQCL
jgi:hypothetical protein